MTLNEIEAIKKDILNTLNSIEEILNEEATTATFNYKQLMEIGSFLAGANTLIEVLISRLEKGKSVNLIID